MANISSSIGGFLGGIASAAKSAFSSAARGIGSALFNVGNRFAGSPTGLGSISRGLQTAGIGLIGLGGGGKSSGADTLTNPAASYYYPSQNFQSTPALLIGPEGMGGGFYPLNTQTGGSAFVDVNTGRLLSTFEVQGLNNQLTSGGGGFQKMPSPFPTTPSSSTTPQISTTSTTYASGSPTSSLAAGAASLPITAMPTPSSRFAGLPDVTTGLTPGEKAIKDAQAKAIRNLNISASEKQTLSDIFSGKTTVGAVRAQRFPAVPPQAPKPFETTPSATQQPGVYRDIGAEDVLARLKQANISVSPDEWEAMGGIRKGETFEQFWGRLTELQNQEAARLNALNQPPAPEILQPPIPLEQKRLEQWDAIQKEYKIPEDLEQIRQLQNNISAAITAFNKVADEVRDNRDFTQSFKARKLQFINTEMQRQITPWTNLLNALNDQVNMKFKLAQDKLGILKSAYSEQASLAEKQTDNARSLIAQLAGAGAWQGITPELGRKAGYSPQQTQQLADAVKNNQTAKADKLLQDMQNAAIRVELASQNAELARQKAELAGQVPSNWSDAKILQTLNAIQQGGGNLQTALTQIDLTPTLANKDRAAELAKQVFAPLPQQKPVGGLTNLGSTIKSYLTSQMPIIGPIKVAEGFFSRLFAR